jgi:CheY-like chemotaxis protein
MPSPKILLVEDDPAIRTLMVTWLDTAGYDVRTIEPWNNTPQVLTNAKSEHDVWRKHLRFKWDGSLLLSVKVIMRISTMEHREQQDR